MRAQIGKARADVSVTERDLLQVPTGPRTEACLRNNCVVGVQVRRSRDPACCCF
jgi:malate synthase